jgi:hypothetical protein
MPCIHKNLLWCVITEPAARDRFLNYDTEVPFLVARLRSGYGAHVGEPAWEENIARLQRLSPEFERLWNRHEVAQPERRVRVFRTRSPVTCGSSRSSSPWAATRICGSSSTRPRTTTRGHVCPSSTAPPPAPATITEQRRHRLTLHPV